MKAWKKIKEQFGGVFGKEPDPDISTHKKRKHKPRRRYAPPPCIPGTITYKDRLVKHLGYDRRAADDLIQKYYENANDRQNARPERHEDLTLPDL